MKINQLVIIGYGVEGKSAYEYYRDKAQEIIVLDEKEPKFEVPAGVRFVQAKVEDYDFSEADLIIRTPAVDPRRIQGQGSRAKGEEPKIWSLVNEFFAVCPTKHIIGVTGTKGKGTTATLVYLMLLKAGLKAHLGGNIGVPVLDLLPQIQPNDVVVLELSSFQLWDFVGKPETAILLKIEPEHLDIHKDMQDYKDAKANLFKTMHGGRLVYYKDNEISNELATRFVHEKHSYLDPNYQLSCYVENDHFKIDGYEICHVDDMKLIGEHNYQNVCAAITAVWPYTQDVVAMRDVVSSYSGQPHRLQKVGVSNDGIEFYDDSIGVVPTATIAAMQAVKAPKIMLLGGKSRGLDLSEMADAVMKQNVAGVVLSGETTDLIAGLLEERGFSSEALFKLPGSRMNEVVPAAVALARETRAKAIVLSSGNPSFDLYKDYVDKAEQFLAAIKEYTV
jgi:UDP-N-acetylmuramoylalanine--D-glutamate ligase